MLSFDHEILPDEDFKPGKKFLSTTTMIVACCFFVLAVILVGLLCGLLTTKKTCNAGGLEPTVRSTFPVSEIPLSTKTSSTPVTTDSLTSPWQNLRLPLTLKPSHYDLEIKVDITDQQRFVGTMSVLMKCLSDTDVILMHSKELALIAGSAKLEKVTPDGGAAPGFLREPWTFAENQYLVAQLDGMLMASEEYRFTIGFEAPLEDGGLVGFYRSSYDTAAGETRYVAATFFAPTNARKAFPCFDEPAMKATFNVTLIHQEGYIALGNMPLMSNETTADGWIKAAFEKTKPMSTYIVCYVVCDFWYRESTTANNVTLRVWARREALSSVGYALEKSVTMLDYFDYYFGTKFPLPKMDMIAIPDFYAGAMENWGLITYREATLLFTPGQSSASDQQRICTVVAHELAHQWFGNLVSFEWWNDLWLKEGFASYIKYLGANISEPDWGMTDQFVADDYQGALEVDALATSRPIIVDVLTPDDINQQYDAIAYDKGSSIIRMIQNFLGESTFRKGLEIYLDRFAYGNAVNTDLWNCFTEAAIQNNKTDIDVKEIMDTWTLQMGYPTIHINRDYQGEPSFSAKQSRFLINPEANTTSNYEDLGYVWYVPFRYTTDVERNFAEATLAWMEPNATLSVSIPGSTATDDWILVNINAYGYYRVNYDEHNLHLLMDQLMTSHNVIPISNRASLISDAFTLAQSGQLSHATAFNLSLYLTQEREYVPWKMAKNVMEYIDLMLARSPAYGSFQKYMRQLVTPFYDYVGWNDTSSAHLEQLGRVVAIGQSCSYGNEDCISMATSLFSASMANPSDNSIPPNQKYDVYCTAIAAGGQNEWYFALDQYDTTIVASERAILLQALACSKQPWILSTYLEMTLDRIKSQDAVSVVTYVANNRVGSDLAWMFFQANWDFFRQAYGSSLFQFARLIEGVTAYFNTEFQLEGLLKFIAEHPDQGTGARALAQAVDQTKANIKWIQNYEEQVKAWLHWAVTI